MPLVVDPWHWLDEDGTLPTSNSALRKQALRIARFIEYGGPLEPREMRETLIDCIRRKSRKQCAGLMWVTKTNAGDIHAFCPTCGEEEVLVHNWEDTDWADGPMIPVPVDPRDALH